MGMISALSSLPLQTALLSFQQFFGDPLNPSGNMSHMLGEEEKSHSARSALFIVLVRAKPRSSAALGMSVF